MISIHNKITNKLKLSGSFFLLALGLFLAGVARADDPVPDAMVSAIPGITVSPERAIVLALNDVTPNGA